MSTEYWSGPAYRIETPRLVIRCWQPVDAPLLKDAIDSSLDHLRAWMPWAENEPQSIQQKIDLLRRFRGNFDLGQDFTYGIFDRQERRVLGGTGLHTRSGVCAREIGYWIRSDSTRQGFATETVAALTIVGFEIEKLDRVEIHIDIDNHASAAVPEKLGFIHEATLQRRLPRNGNQLGETKMHDMMVWSMFTSQYVNCKIPRLSLTAYNAANRVIYSG